MNLKKNNILEFCSEDAHGSWEFWSESENKTKEELIEIVDAIAELVSEKKIIALEHKSGGPYVGVFFDLKRLQMEVEKSMTPNNTDPEEFYWFAATEEGKKEDLAIRAAR